MHLLKFMPCPAPGGSASKRAESYPTAAAAAAAAASKPASAIVDKAAAKKARKLERRRLREELGIQLSEQQQQAALSEEERAHRKAAKRLRQALARAETSTHDRSTRTRDASSAGFHSHMTPAVASSHPFLVTDERDHAETPFEA
jgi:hypothetical protein